MAKRAELVTDEEIEAAEREETAKALAAKLIKVEIAGASGTAKQKIILAETGRAHF